MSDRIGFTDIREWQGLTNGTRSALGRMNADVNIELQRTTLPDMTQLTEIINLLNATTQKYREVARRDATKMRIACERMREMDEEISAAWGSGR